MFMYIACHTMFVGHAVPVRDLKPGTKSEQQFIELNQGQTNKVLTGTDQCNAGNSEIDMKVQKQGQVVSKTESTKGIQIINDVTCRGSKPEGSTNEPT